MFAIFPLIVLLSACASHPLQPPMANGDPYLTETAFITVDGQSLPFHQWQPATSPNAVILALHGFNDYGRFIDQPAQFFSGNGIAVFAIDQRGFGASQARGRWAGSESYARDLSSLAAILRRKYPELPLYILGESMGGAVAIVAAANHGLGHVDGLILAAPALWARWTMPWYQRSLLWLGNHLTPWMKLTGDGLDITPSNNFEMLRALSRDPLVIKETRIDAIAGLTNLMDKALAAAPKLKIPTLLMYGEKDQLVPKQPTLTFIQQAPPGVLTTAWYANGYHMLLRDLEAERYWQDILAWIRQPGEPLPSGADRLLPSAPTELALTMKPNEK